jgi:hypothetical protein
LSASSFSSIVWGFSQEEEEEEQEDDSGTGVISNTL